MPLSVLVRGCKYISDADLSEFLWCDGELYAWSDDSCLPFDEGVGSEADALMADALVTGKKEDAVGDSFCAPFATDSEELTNGSPLRCRLPL